MLRFVVLSALVALSYGYAASMSEVKQAFEQFKAEHGVVYADAKEEAHRFKLFNQNWVNIKAHNKRADNGEHSHWLGVNKFADLSHEEIVHKQFGGETIFPKSAPSVHQYTGDDLPDSVDWREKGAITGVKEQGGCGTAWAFATVAAIEGANFLATGKLVSLSEQHLLDCDRSINVGCGLGYMWNAFEYVISNKGIAAESKYPYRGFEFQCAYNSSKLGATISSYANITSGDEKALLSAVAQQPVAVHIDPIDAIFYKNGIIGTGAFCKSDFDYLSYGMTIVGYGTESSTDYWIIKGSWGKDYGENGYLRLQRGLNLCGVATAASYPIV